MTPDDMTATETRAQELVCSVECRDTILTLCKELRTAWQVIYSHVWDRAKTKRPHYRQSCYYCATQFDPMENTYCVARHLALL